VLKKNWGIKESILYLFGEPVAGYSRFVSMVKIGLILVALLLSALLIALPFFSSAHKNYKLTFSHIETSEDEAAPTMVNPRFQGIDNKDQPYSVTAARAIQESEEILLLEKIAADVSFENEEWISLLASEGTFFTTGQILDILGDVTLFSSEGYDIRTESAQVDFERGEMFGSTKITGNGPLGSLEADSFAVESESKNIVFNGNVKVVFYPESNSKEQQESQ
jgi:lipopolysaccharide export system protein LptC